MGNAIVRSSWQVVKTYQGIIYRTLPVHEDCRHPKSPFYTAAVHLYCGGRNTFKLVWST